KSQSTSQNPAGTTGAGDPGSPDERARATEARMTDDERFSLLISILGTVPGGALAPDPRVRNIKNQSAGYTPGIPRLDPAAHRESDLLAFQIAIERSQPGAIMSGYNKVNGEPVGGSHHLLNEVLKGAWGYKGYVMSDWGAVPEWEFAVHGLDQESGAQADKMMWKLDIEPFVGPLRQAYRDGKFPKERLSDMVQRILRSAYAVGIDTWKAAPAVDLAKHNQIALDIARQGIVLLKNDGALPLATDKPLKVAVIGGYAQQGVISGTGSGAVAPVGGFAGQMKIGGAGVMGRHRNMTFPADLAQTPRPELSGLGTPWGTPVTIRYDEGAEAGYRWYAQKNQKPLYAYGHGLSYTTFDYADFKVSGGETITATFTVTITGKVAGADVPQVYLTAAPDGPRMRLLGFERVDLKPGESKTVTLKADPRLLARFDGPKGLGQWRIAEGTYRVVLGKSAGDVVRTSDATLSARMFGR
ncbi:MAG TPA: fibronectin type III-like domain-contianing protein, partial [Vicinamibacterales bacterium]